MLTEVGKFLRKVRIDNDEILMDMANKLEVSASFLSAVENGKKSIPDSWLTKIPALYSFDDEKNDEFEKAIAHTKESIELDLSTVSSKKKELVFSLARKINDFDDEQIATISKILKEAKK